MPTRVRIMLPRVRAARHRRGGSFAARPRKKLPKLNAFSPAPNVAPPAATLARGERRASPAGTRAQSRRCFPTTGLEGQMETYDAHKTTTEVRQASRRMGNFWVLIVSGIGIIAIFAIIFL